MHATILATFIKFSMWSYQTHYHIVMWPHAHSQTLNKPCVGYKCFLFILQSWVARMIGQYLWCNSMPGNSVSPTQWQNLAEQQTTCNVKIGRLPAFPLEVQVICWSSHSLWPTVLLSHGSPTIIRLIMYWWTSPHAFSSKQMELLMCFLYFQSARDHQLPQFPSLILQFLVGDQTVSILSRAINKWRRKCIYNWIYSFSW